MEGKSESADTEGASVASDVDTEADAGGDWPTYRGNAANTGVNPGAAESSGPMTERWEWSAPSGATIGDPVVADGRVFFVVTDEQDEASLVALDAAAGTVLWRRSVPWNQFFDHLTVADGLIYRVDSTATLRAYDATDGTETLAVPLVPDPGPARGHPVRVVDGVAFAVVNYQVDQGGGLLVAYDVENPSIRWRYTATDGLSIPAVADGVVYFFDGGELRALDADTCDVLWTQELGVHGTPVVANDTVYLHSSGDILALDAADGSVRWRRDEVNGMFMQGVSVPAVTGDAVYVGLRQGGGTSLGASGGANFFAFDPATGDLKWGAGFDVECSPTQGGLECEEPSSYWTSPTVGDRNVYAGYGTDEGEGGLRAYDRDPPADVQFPDPRWTYSSASLRTSPVPAGDSLYFTTEGGHLLVALESE